MTSKARKFGECYHLWVRFESKMDRPELAPQTSVADFKSFYWLKNELAAFCREHGLSTAGSKRELSARIEAFLATGEIQPASREAKRRSAARRMPDTLSRDTVIGPGFRCSQPLRAFFVTEIGPQFHFNGVMREFIKNGAGKTLQDAIDAWHADRRAPQAKTEIEPQFEYNRHIREFFKANPGKTLQDAILAWNEKKARRTSE